jgi:type VI secretion system secreted protein Hcp
MPIFVNYGSIAGSGGKGRVLGMKQGNKTLTPGNLSFAIESPRDPHTGLASGKRQHSPLVIIKESEPSTPLFFRAANQTFPTLTLYFKSTDAQGKEQLYFMIALTNAVVSHHRQYQPGQPGHTEELHTNEIEEIELTFQKIVYTNVSGKKAATDDWNVGP